MLTVDDFGAFFAAVHGVEPFPWQKELLRSVVEAGRWPSVLDLPTGAGKTAAMDIAVFHLAMETSRDGRRLAPVRIAFVVDRRLVVDDAFARARKLEAALATPPDDTVARVAQALRNLAGPDAPPLIARRLRGGVPREDDWARTPSQPTILCSTVDQVGSRLLFRGYGVSDSMKPVHAGLMGTDCLILLDEAHLAEPFRQTLGWVETYRSRRWREADEAGAWGVALLTATPGAHKSDFGLVDADLAHPLLQRRLAARKPARLVVATRGRAADREEGGEESDSETRDLPTRVAALVDETTRALEHFSNPEHGALHPAIGVVVNRVPRARAVHQKLAATLTDVDVHLLIGPARPVDRDAVVAELLAPIRTGTERTLTRPLVIVATQCIEAGVDIDLDGLITEAAPLDALRQRFGRLNRDGREIVPYSAIVAWKADLAARYDDPIYGKAIGEAWRRLESHASDPRSKVVDFGVSGFSVPLDEAALSRKDPAPVLMPAHLDLLCQTSPVPAADPEVGFFLHGTSREPDAITVVWRADIHPDDPAEGVRRLLMLAPPRAAEAIELPVWAVRRWLRSAPDPGLLADSPTAAPDDSDEGGRRQQRAFRWKGDDERSRWVSPSEIRPGDTIVVPAEYGGVDAFGWNPEYGKRPGERATDMGADAAGLFAGRRFVVRVAPGLLVSPGESELTLEEAEEQLVRALAGAEGGGWKELRDALLDLALPPSVRRDLLALDEAKKPGRGGRGVISYTDVYPADSEGRTRGVVFVAPLGIKGTLDDSGFENATEEAWGSLAGFPVTLEQHSRNVRDLAVAFAERAGLPTDRQSDLKVAAYLHDIGKADPGFQAWLHHGDPLGVDPAEPSSILAKSGRTLPRTARQAAGLPDYWRHEPLSVRLAPLMPAFADAKDPELVLWLIGSHHGYGRSLFPHRDAADAEPRVLPPAMDLPETLPAGAGPQSLAFDWNGADWPTLYARVRRRYGIWELAHMECILRLADHRASELEASRSSN